MYCSNCGTQVADQAAVCVHCGHSVEKQRKAEGDSKSAGWWWLGFFVPLAGLLIWVFCHDTTPIKAKKAGVGAIVGTVVSVVLAVLFYILYFVFFFWMINGMNEMVYSFV